MTSDDWMKVLTAAFGSGITLKVLDIIYTEWRRTKDRGASAAKFVDEHLDPILKAADELVGKLVSLGREDFKTFRTIDEGNPFGHSDFASLAFLFARFWAQIEIFHRGALYVSIAEDRRGKQLQLFLDCLESRGVRLIDRISQRALGETLISESGQTTIQYIAFRRALSDPLTAQWVIPISSLLVKAWHTTERQKLLRYGTVVHALIDTLDPRHSVTRNRPAIPNKLSEQTERDLKYRVFGNYLKFVANRPKYIGRPKRGGR